MEDAYAKMHDAIEKTGRPMVTPETREILLNKEVLAIDQDPAGHQADRLYAQGPLEVWGKTLADGSRAIGLFNRNDTPQTLSISMAQFGMPHGARSVRDLWQHRTELRDVGTEDYKSLIPPHGVVLLRMHRAAAQVLSGATL